MSKYYDFHFVIYGLSSEQADQLFKTIVEQVESMDLEVGGGYHQDDDMEDGSDMEAQHGSED